MNFWNQAPFVRLVLPLMAGIIAGAFFPCYFTYSFSIVLVLTTVFIYLSFSGRLHSKFNLRWVYGVFLFLLFFIYGYEITILNTGKLFPPHYRNAYVNKDKIIARVAESTIAKEKSYKTVLSVEGIVKKEGVQPAKGKILTYFQKDSISDKIRYGNLIVFTADPVEIPPPGNPSEFNYKQFLSFHRVYDQVYLNNKSFLVLDDTPLNTVEGIANRARNFLMLIFKKYGISGNEYAVASALMLGSREEIDPELVQAYASSGALHVLSVSGLHVGVIFMVMNYLLIFLEKVKCGGMVKTIILLLGLWFYAFLTGLSPSVVRASTMFSFIVIGKAGKWNTNIFNILACSAFFLLIINPFLIMEVGFQLSYLAVLGIVYIQPKLDVLWDAHIPAAGRIGNWFIEQIWTITTISIAAQLATFALGLLYFHQFPNYFLFSNLVVIPLSTIIIYLGVLLFVVSPFEIIADHLSAIFKNCIYLLNESVLLVENLPYSLLQGISISVFETWLIYILILLMLSFFILGKTKFLRFSFLILISLLIFQIGESYFERNQKKFVVYNINNTSACDFIDGKENYLVADSSLLINDSRILFHIKHYWWDIGINTNHFFATGSGNEFKGKELFMKGEFAQFCNKRFAFINNKIPNKYPSGKTKVDYIVISGSPGISVSKLMEWFEFRQIILDSSNKNYFTEKFMKEAGEAGVLCYSVIGSGAYILEMD